MGEACIGGVVVVSLKRMVKGLVVPLYIVAEVKADMAACEWVAEIGKCD